MYRVGERVAKPGEGPFSRFMFTEQVSKAQVIYRLGGAASRTTAPSTGLRTSMARRSAFSNSLVLSEASTGAAGYWGSSRLRRGRLRAERASRGLDSTGIQVLPGSVRFYFGNAPHSSRSRLTA